MSLYTVHLLPQRSNTVFKKKFFLFPCAMQMITSGQHEVLTYIAYILAIEIIDIKLVCLQTYAGHSQFPEPIHTRVGYLLSQ